ncbi:uncharacterized protein DUF4328 [Streptomyces sp. CG 926]|uniref:DUF4328 domain-containing protein n=1 Tax=Streptomyces sp. CG 926 TaxID=1882405 RepID=UPI000D79ABF8|nr:DUF4328 domain-containing protein [Streptomyces sp. CG 926]PWK74384.1 uncharacterized protein DUF4328 [Streptomyces sp. CG 926]
MSFGTRSLPPLGPPPVRSSILSPGGLATALTVLLGVCAATRVLMVVAGADRYGALDGVTDPDPSWALYSAVMGMTLLAMVPTAVVFIIWFHRVRVNAGVFAPDMFRRGAGWAIGVWFIPLVGPTLLAYGIAVRVWTASASKSAPGGPASGSASMAPVAAWCATFGAAMLTSLATGRVAEARTSVLVGMASDLLYAVAALLAVVWVRRLSALQSRA